jgi:hypothetical protein
VTKSQPSQPTNFLEKSCDKKLTKSTNQLFSKKLVGWFDKYLLINPLIF